jgi:hypothetical protein
MKKIFLSLAVITASLSACKNTTNQGEEKGDSIADSLQVENTESQMSVNYFGDTISDEGAVATSELLAMVTGNDSIAVKVVGTVNSSCQKKGCWMKMDMGNGEEMRVSFKDYSFFVPKNLNGETAIIEGYAFVDTIDVDFLKHLAEDAGKSKDEIAAISEPEISVNFMANGVIIKS